MSATQGLGTGGDYNTQVGMTLAAIAYAAPIDIPRQLAYPAYATKGQWTPVWMGMSSSNQMYVAQLAGGGQHVVAIRGSVDDPFTEAFWIDWFRDLDVFTTLPLPFGDVPGARISLGTADGLTDLLAMRDATSGQTVVEFLRQHATLESWGVVVLGHSLGGCLATVLAPYLYEELCRPNHSPECITPMSFAAPTAGNAAFAGYLEALYDDVPHRYVNSLDIAPMAFSIGGLGAILKTYDPAPTIDYLVWAAIDWYWSDFEKLGYAQPGADGGGGQAHAVLLVVRGGRPSACHEDLPAPLRRATGHVPVAAEVTGRPCAGGRARSNECVKSHPYPRDRAPRLRDDAVMRGAVAYVMCEASAGRARPRRAGCGCSRRASRSAGAVRRRVSEIPL